MMTLKQLVMKMLREEWSAHYDYCDVFDDEYDGKGLTPTGEPCSEDCANGPANKVLLEKSGKIKEV